MPFLLALLLAAVAGTLMPVQGALDSWLARHSSLAVATLWVHTSAAIATALTLLVPAARGSWIGLIQAPTTALFGGVAGVVITWTVAAAVTRLGMVNATTGILVAQIVTAAVLDHFGWLGLERLPFTFSRGVGALLLVMGAWLLIRH